MILMCQLSAAGLVMRNGEVISLLTVDMVTRWVVYVYNSTCEIVSQNALIWNSQTYAVTISIYNFAKVFHGIPVKTFIVAML